MRKLSSGRFFLGATAMAATIALATPASAQDFFQTLFGGFHAPRPTYHQPRMPALPFADEGFVRERERVSRPSQRSYASSGQAYCVRTCDGRYFPISATGGDTKAEVCNSFCPASDTKVVYGSSIDNAATDTGKAYSQLPNAFRYRKEIVDGCTCNGKDHFGLAKIDLDHDPTVRKGDIVASADGLMVAGHSADRRQGALNLSPASASIRNRYQRLPVVASQ